MSGVLLEKNIFIVVLGGRKNKSNIELHDVRWVIGETIGDTFDQLRREWFGDRNGLHIDSYIKVKFIDGFFVRVREKVNKRFDSFDNDENERLWFINLGGYSPNNLVEYHNFQLLIAKTKKDARNKAMRRISDKYELGHIDDIKEVKCSLPEKQLPLFETPWEISLIPDSKNRNQSMKPDWYGYMRIDH